MLCRYQYTTVPTQTVVLWLLEKKKGSVSIKKKKKIQSVAWISCKNRCLNCPKVQIFNTMKEVEFFNMSAKRNFSLKSNLGKGLKSVCDACWVKKYDTTLDIQTNFKLSHCIRRNSKFNGCYFTSSLKVNILLKSLLSIDFLVSLKMVTFFLS